MSSRLMRRLAFQLCFVLTMLMPDRCLSTELMDPVADPASIVRAGNARFTVLSPSLVRLEWSPTGIFEDRATQGVVNRRLPVPHFTTGEIQGVFTLSTDRLTVRYRPERGRFASDSLTVIVRTGTNDDTKEVAPPFKDEHNLGGTVRTLDDVSGAVAVGEGLLSRAGWTCLDDSRSLVFDNSDPPWLMPRSSDQSQDYYFFCYATNYKQLLAEYVSIAGRIPLPPRYAFGTWWSRYWPYSDQELRALVNEFREQRVPLDVLVVDMDWHLDGWTGYSWNTKLFPDPPAFLRWTHENGLRVVLNLHPAEGVGKHEQRFGEMCRELGLDATKTQRIAFDCTDRKFIEAYFKVLHRPLEADGVDFWWIDWQQGTKSPMAGLDPLWWLNHLHWRDQRSRARQTGKRPLILSRWSGAGGHRTPIQFSGDTCSNWSSLAFQPYFTATAGNTGCAYWSHDIGGHFPGPVEPELFTRWLQWGALSPIMRTHAAKHEAAERRIWKFPTSFQAAMRGAYELRYKLLPYLYSAARECFDTGLPMCRPLYYEWPDMEEAYRYGGEYLLGPDLLAAPVTTPSDPLSGCAMVEVWLPPGEWTHWYTGRTYRGPKTVRLVVPLEEIPLFARAGAVIATQADLRADLRDGVDPWLLQVFPGERNQATVYEDDGVSEDYSTDFCARTRVSHVSFTNRRVLRVEPTQGFFPQLRKSRRYEFHIRETWPVGGMSFTGGYPKVMHALEDWSQTYQAEANAIRLHSPEMATTDGAEIQLTGFASRDSEQLLRDGWRGMNRLVHDIASKSPMVSDFLARCAIVEDVEDAARPALLARNVLNQWPELLRLLGESKLEAADKLRYLIRALGLHYTTRIVPESTDGKHIAALIRVSQSMPIEALRAMKGEVRFQTPPGWELLTPPSQAFDAVSENEAFEAHGVYRTVGDLRTVILMTEIAAQLGEVQVMLPLEKVIWPSISTWWLLGPLDCPIADGLTRQYAPERGVNLKEVIADEHGERLSWRPFKRAIRTDDDLQSEFFVDLATVFGHGQQDRVAYGFVHLDTLKDDDAFLAVGSIDGLAIWLNGKEVLRRDVRRAYRSKEDRVSIKLHKGRNSLLVKTAFRKGKGGFCVHVEDATGRPMTQIVAGL